MGIVCLFCVFIGIGIVLFFVDFGVLLGLCDLCGFALLVVWVLYGDAAGVGC